MVYIDPIITNDSFTIFSGAPNTGTPPPAPANRNVRVLYNGVNIHDITKGNVPLVSIKENSNTTPNGELYSSTVQLTLTGKILAENKGITGILDNSYNFRSMFFGNSGNAVFKEPKDQYNGFLKILCGSDSNEAFSVTGVRVVSLNIDESGDNWTQGADYTVELEYSVPRRFDALNNEYYVKSTIDTWSIEPLDEYAYYMDSGIKLSNAVIKEKHNPKLKPTAATEASPQPSDTNNFQLRIVNIPQYRISRKLSAVGLPRHSGLSGTFHAYQNAQEWVKDRLIQAYQPSGTGGIHVSLDQETCLYNHLRTIRFSIQDASYEVNDSWLAMPVKIGYTEDYTVSMSTEEGHIKNVKIQGEIKGLVKANNQLTSGTSGVIPSSRDTSIGLNELMMAKPETSGLSYSIPDARDGSTANVTSVNTALQNVKYSNASDAWISDIKPYLFRRANLIMHSVDRDRSYINNFTTDSRAQNPIYSYERPLNPNPISSSETHDPRKGTINYSYEFTNKFKYFDKTLSENITISDTHPTDVINESFVLGRRLGPVLQDLGTSTSAKKQIDLEIMVPPPTSIKGFFMSHPDCPLYIGGTLYTSIRNLMNQLKPFGDRPTYVFGSNGQRTPAVNDSGNLYISSDTHSWEPTEGIYRLSMGWTYQHCLVTEQTLDQ